MVEQLGWHTSNDQIAPVIQSDLTLKTNLTTVTQRDLDYDFSAHFHPYVLQLMKRLQSRSIRGLQEADTDASLNAPLAPVYQPVSTFTDPADFPSKELDFDSDGAYAVYNWELFYHVPIAVAIHLSRNQRFFEAQQWFHYVFDPTDDSDGPTPQRFWRVKPLQSTDIELIERILTNLANPTDDKLRDRTIAAIDAWREAPFSPHRIARYRPTAYMFKAVMAYLDNLIDWGDSLFRQDTRESVYEALQIYVLAANILAQRPQEVPHQPSVRTQTYATLRADLAELGKAAIAMESELPLDISPHPTETDAADRLATLRSLGFALYFCVPRNDKLIGYWDTVADRLFKIRNSLNIQGVFRQLALFEPPIDPALLARAAAAGLDIGAIVSGLNQPLPLVRFSLLVQKALEIAQEVKNLGSSLLATFEKEDAEQLALLRARHERTVLDLAESVRYAQWQETMKAREALERTLRNAIERYTYYERLLGAKDIPDADLDDLDTDSLLAALKFNQDEPELKRRDLPVNIASDLGETGGRLVSSKELEELAKLADAHDSFATAGKWKRYAGVASYVPSIEVSTKPIGVGGGVTFGGEHLAPALNFVADFYRADGDQATYEAGRAGKLAGYERRELEWAFQSNTIAGEIESTYKQLRAAQIREAISQREYDNHTKQMAHAAEIEQFLRGEKTGSEKYRKTSTLALYTWMKREVRGLYGQCFQFAFDVARKAERALQHELGDPTATFVQFGYTEGKEGLLAGERLYLDLKRMELAYHELNRREYELTKHISLRQLAPLALMRLRATGRCTVELPEDLFDLDCPGHYFRRIRSVAVTIPCVVGPYASVNCTLTLLKSSIRKSPQLLDGVYARDGDDTERFSDHFGSMQGIVTSSGQNDSGLFETNLHDERLLPFEGSGAISQWQLELPTEVAQFNPDTIADVILHLRFTAREGGKLLRDAAVSNVDTKVAEATAAGSVLLLSVRHDFANEWAAFTAAPVPAQGYRELTLTLREEHYPYWARRILGQDLALRGVQLLAASAKGSEIGVSGQTATLVPDESLGVRIGAVELTSSDVPIGTFSRGLTQNTMSDLWLALVIGAET